MNLVEMMGGIGMDEGLLRTVGHGDGWVEMRLLQGLTYQVLPSLDAESRGLVVRMLGTKDLDDDGKEYWVLGRRPVRQLF